MKKTCIGMFLLVSGLLATVTDTLTAEDDPWILVNFSAMELNENSAEDELKIMKRLCPDENIENLNLFLSSSTDTLPQSKITERLSLIENLDLTGLNIKRISIKLCKQLKNVKVLNLSLNPSIKMHENWIEYFYENLEELNLRNCFLNNTVFDTLKNFKRLQKLNISGTFNLNLASESFIHILKNLKYLDVSSCRLSTSDFLSIITKNESLNSLIFSNNNLSLINNIEFRNGSLVVAIDNIEYEESPKTTTSFDLVDNKKTILLETVEKLYHLLGKLKDLDLKNCSIDCERFIRMLFQLPYLETLALSKNSINYDYFNISSNGLLKRLELSNCGIDKADTLKTFVCFENLQVLNISHNNFKHLDYSFHVGYSSSLVQLNISNCQLQADALCALTCCQYLKALNVSGNCFEDMKLGFDFWWLRFNLLELNISNCKLGVDGLHAVVFQLEKLQKLNISSNCFEDINSYIFLVNEMMPELLELDISNCALNKGIIGNFTVFPKLQKLNASFNSKTCHRGEILTLGCSKASLIKLKLESCKLKAKDLKEISSCTQLQKLNVAKNKLHRLDESFEWGNLSETLVDLNMSTSNLTSKGFESVIKLSKLKYLNASDNFLHSFNLASFGKLEEILVKLSLSHCFLNGQIFEALSKFKALKYLDIPYNDFEKIIPKDFASGYLKDTLVELDISNCNLNKWHFENIIAKFSNLQGLYFSGNHLEDMTNDFDLGNLKETLSLLDVSNCNLSLEGMKKFTHFSNLQKFSISYNTCLKDLTENFDLGNLKNTLLCLKLEGISMTENLILRIINECSKLQAVKFGENECAAKLIKQSINSSRPLSKIFHKGYYFKNE